MGGEKGGEAAAMRGPSDPCFTDRPIASGDVKSGCQITQSKTKKNGISTPIYLFVTCVPTRLYFRSTRLIHR